MEVCDLRFVDVIPAGKGGVTVFEELRLLDVLSSGTQLGRFKFCCVHAQVVSRYCKDGLCPDPSLVHIA